MSLRESKFLADLFLSVIEDEVKKNVKIFKAIPEARRSAPHQYLSARAASGEAGRLAAGNQRRIAVQFINVRSRSPFRAP